MKTCPNCNRQVDDSSLFCHFCGAGLSAGGASGSYSQGASGMGGASALYDHTAEFTVKDISDNKVIAMLTYLLGVAGIIIALLASGNSPYVAFHLRQALKFIVVEVLVAAISLILCLTIIIPIAGCVVSVILWVLRIICFFQVCGGKAIEPAIIRDLRFLK